MKRILVLLVMSMAACAPSYTPGINVVTRAGRLSETAQRDEQRLPVPGYFYNTDPNGSSYIVLFCLETEVLNDKPGPYVATPHGIERVFRERVVKYRPFFLANLITIFYNKDKKNNSQKQKMAKYDIISIGDTTIDAFIEVHEASVHCNVNHSDCQICFSYANKIPYENLIVLAACGNSANNAIGSARLGMKGTYIGAIGDDAHGKDILNEFKKEKVDTSHITINKGVPTNYHFVLVYRGERTILLKHQDFRYSLPSSLETQWIYFSSLAAGTEKFHEEVDKYLQKHKDVKLAFNPGTFQMRMGDKKLGGIYARTEILFLNREEAQLVTKEKSRDIKTLAKKMHKLGAKIAVITDGRAGAYASDGHAIWFIDHFPGPLIEATGAGDAFGTGFTAAIFHGKTVPEAMRWGAINGGNVALHTGPHEGLQTVKQIETWLKKHPKFKAKEYTK